MRSAFLSCTALGILVFCILTPSLPGAQPLKDFVRVVIADKPSLVEKAAAGELVHYLGEISGRKLQTMTTHDFARAKTGGLSFFIGDEAATLALGRKPSPWKTEEHLLKTVRHGLVLAGDDGRGDAWSSQTAAGTMLAVYTLLEDHLGVHWFWPGEFGEHVPHKPDTMIPELDGRQSPAFEIRSVQSGYFSYHTKAFSEAAIKWARRNRLGWVRSAVFGHSWEAAFYLRKDATFKQHPEWFALVKGERKPPQMCTTNPDVIARMVEYVLKGKSDIMNISPSDGGGFCECERCRALDVPGVPSYDGVHPQLSDRIFTYANEVARRVREKNPAKGCGMFAYTYYNKPPLKIAQLEPNLYLSFVFQSAAQRHPDNLREWRENVSGWQKLGAKMVVREGWGNHYYFDLPFLHCDQIIANLAESARLGFIAAYGEGSKSFATQAPNYWAITRMMCDPRRDPAKVMPEFYESAFGPAAKEMEAFFDTYSHALNANWSKLSHNVDSTQIAYANILPAWRQLFPKEVVDEADRHLDGAERLVTEGELAQRIAFHRYGQSYTRMMLDLLENYRLLGIIVSKADGIPATAKKDSPERAALLKQTYELGEQREQLLLAHRDWAGPDEGLYAFTNDAGIRQWHAAVKKELGMETPSPLTKAGLGKK